MLKEFKISTTKRTQFIDVTSQVTEAVYSSGIKEGIAFVYVPHTTAAVTINENADPSVAEDIQREVDKIVPFDNNYSHLEGNSAAHIKSSIVGVSVSLIVNEGKLLLGTWQGIFFCEFDGPRKRRFFVRVV